MLENGENQERILVRGEENEVGVSDARRRTRGSGRGNCEEKDRELIVRTSSRRRFSRRATRNRLVREHAPDAVGTSRGVKLYNEKYVPRNNRERNVIGEG